jgi:hypothetical protein
VLKRFGEHSYGPVSVASLLSRSHQKSASSLAPVCFCPYSQEIWGQEYLPSSLFPSLLVTVLVFQAHAVRNCEY